MTMIRAYTSKDEGLVCCFWEAPSKNDLSELFRTAGVPFDSMIEVREFLPAST
jgi:hypothetical protein